VVDALESADVEITVPNWQLSSELDLMQLLAPFSLRANPWNFERLVNG